MERCFRVEPTCIRDLEEMLCALGPLGEELVWRLSIPSLPRVSPPAVPWGHPLMIATRGSRAGWSRMWSCGALTASLLNDRMTLIRDHPCGLRCISLTQTLATVKFFFHPRPQSCKHKDRNKSLK